MILPAFMIPDYSESRTFGRVANHNVVGVGEWIFLAAFPAYLLKSVLCLEARRLIFGFSLLTSLLSF